MRFLKPAALGAPSVLGHLSTEQWCWSWSPLASFQPPPPEDQTSNSTSGRLRSSFCVKPQPWKGDVTKEQCEHLQPCSAPVHLMSFTCVNAALKWASEWVVLTLETAFSFVTFAEFLRIVMFTLNIHACRVQEGRRLPWGVLTVPTSTATHGNLWTRDVFRKTLDSAAKPPFQNKGKKASWKFLPMAFCLLFGPFSHPCCPG